MLGLFAAFFTLVLERGHSFLQLRSVPITWQQAHWIKYPGGSEVLYVRKRFNLASFPQRAHLKIAAMDNFEVYINGRLIKKKILEGENPSEVYDVASMLRLGSNLLAIRSVSQRKGVDAQIIAELDWKCLGKEYLLASGSDWRVEQREFFQRHGLLTWIRTDFDEGAWPFATLVPTAQIAGIARPLSIHFAAFQRMSANDWLWHNYLHVRRANFMRVLNIDTRMIYGAWLGVSVNGSYQLSINDLIFPKEMGSINQMKLYSIAPYLSAGENRFIVQVYAEKNGLPKIAMTGGISTSEGWMDFSGNQQWQCLEKSCQIILLEPITTDAPQIVESSLTPPIKYILQQWQKRFSLFGIVFLGTLIPSLLFIPLFKLCGINWSHAWVLYGQPYVLASFLMVLFFIADLDVRWNFAPFYAVHVPIVVMLVIFIGLILPVVECLWRSDKDNMA